MKARRARPPSPGFWAGSSERSGRSDRSLNSGFLNMQGCPPPGGTPFITPLRSPGTGGPLGPPVPGNLSRTGHGERAMKQIFVALVALLAASAAAQAQVVKDFVDVEGARANKIRGYGIVTGLNGAGDSPRG